MSNQELNKRMAEMAAYAVEHAQKQGFTLDYSNESIETVEKLLTKMYSQATTVKPDERQYADFARIFGAYIGTTLIKNLKKGEWVLTPDNALAVQIDTSLSFFPAKVYRRLKNGPEDNVTALYLNVYNQYADKKISLKVFA